MPRFFINIHTVIPKKPSFDFIEFNFYCIFNFLNFIKRESNLSSILNEKNDFL